jgi:ferritin-like metal-binding protein YciE
MIRCVLALALGLLLCTRASADPPATAAAEPQKPVRQVGGDHGPKVEAQAEPDAVPGRDAMRRTREQLHERIEEARAHMKEARDQVQEARDQVKSAVDKAPDEARAAMEKARAEGREAMQQARDAMKEARESLKQALPGAGPKERAERARYARRMAWHAMMHRVRRPSDIPPAMREELRHHARRMARLARIRAIATDKKDEAVTKRCDALITREQARHETKMAQLQKALPPPAPPPRAAANQHEDDEDPAEPEPAEEEEQEEP